MADTLESVYLNTSIGSTELDDGEQTILTTDSTTRYVIKDLFVNNTTSLSNTFLELNGFNVGSLTSNATGSLIIPPNSTLKIKTTDYPFAFTENFTWLSNSNSAGFQIQYKDNAGNVVGSTIEHMGSGHLQQNTDVISDVHYAPDNNGTAYLYYHSNDGNSVQRSYAWRLSDDNVISILNANYKPFGLHNNKFYYFNNATFRVKDLSTSPTGATFTDFNNVSNWNGGSNSYSPYPTSSYPRGRASHGYFWHIPSSSYSNYIYAVKLEGSNAGQYYVITFPNNMSMSSTRDFVISPDETDNKLYIYRHQNSGSIYQHIINDWTAFQAVNQNSTASYSPDSNTSISTPDGNILQNGMASVQFGSLLNGGMTYHNNSYEMIELDKNGTKINETPASAISFDGYGHSSPSNGFWKTQRSLAQSEVTSLGLTAPTFGVQLLGIKSTS